MAKTYLAAPNPEPKAIVIYCFDPRFRKAFTGFIEEELGLQPWEFIPLTIAGGPAPLAHPEEMFNRCRTLIRQMMFTCEHFKSIKKIILIGHQDCGYYSIVPSNGDKEEREKKDLPIAAKLLKLMIPEGTTIEMYYAHFEDAERTQISFQPIS